MEISHIILENRLSPLRQDQVKVPTLEVRGNTAAGGLTEAVFAAFHREKKYQIWETERGKRIGMVKRRLHVPYFSLVERPALGPIGQTVVV